MATQQIESSAPQPVSPLEGEVVRLQALLDQGHYQDALDAVTPLLVTWPENRDLLLIAAMAQRHLKHTVEALALLTRLDAVKPNFPPALQERGLCYVALRDATQAIDTLRLAVAINPALPMAWRMLDGLCRMIGNTEGADIAMRQCAHLASLPPPIVRAKSLFYNGEVKFAERLIRDFLLTYGDHPEAMRLLAQIGFIDNVLDDVELLYTGVLAMVPDHHEARAEYVQTLIARHKFAAASEALQPLLVLDPASHPHRTQLATIAVGLGEHQLAITQYRAMLAEIEDDDFNANLRRADLYLWLGHALKTVGDLPEAIAAYRAATDARPDFGDAWWSLANLKIYRFDDRELDTIRRCEADPATVPIDRIHLAFALGKALEDRREYERSWAAYARGNAEKRIESKYRPEVYEKNTSEQKRICTPALFAARSGWGVEARDPIFVLGLPRSGSTLIEQILASHSLVEGTQELPEIVHIVHELQGREMDFEEPRYPQSLIDLDAQAVRKYGEQFMRDTRAYRIMGRPFFIDKMPNNFRHIGLIHLILPNATIIDARRNPMDCCFSNLKQLFAQGQEFTYSIEDIARYYRTYLDLMRHWDTVLPGRVLRLINEDLIDDPEGQIRRLLDHCGLPFEDACLNFHQTRRSVRTPSSEQVRRPISRAGVDQWKPYAQWLDPLADALGDALETWRD